MEDVVIVETSLYGITESLAYSTDIWGWTGEQEHRWSPVVLLRLSVSVCVLIQHPPACMLLTQPVTSCMNAQDIDGQSSQPTYISHRVPVSQT